MSIQKTLCLIWTSICLISLSVFASDEEVDQALELLKQSKLEEALPILEGVLAREPENPTALFLRGMTYSRMKKFKEAIIDFRKSKEIGNDFTIYDLELGKALFFIRDYPNAISHLRKYEETFPGDQEAVRLLGYAYFFSKQYKNAKKYLELALERGNEDADAINYCLALCAAQEKNPKQLVDRLHATMKVSTKDSWFQQSAARLVNIAEEYRDQADKNWWLQFQFGGGYDSDPRAFGDEVPDNVDQKYDWFLLYFIRGQYNVKLGVGTTLYMRGSLFGKKYFELEDEIDQVIPSGEFGIYHTINENFFVDAGIRDDYIFLDYDSFSNNLTGFINLGWKATEWYTTVLEYEYQHRWFYFEDNADRNDLEGPYHTLGIYQDIFIKSLKTNVRFGYRRLYADPEGDNLDRSADKFFIQFGSYIVWDFYVGARFEYVLGDFQEPNEFAIDVGDERYDQGFFAQIYLSKKLTGPLSFFMAYNLERVDSNVPVFDYKRDIITAGFIVSY